MDDCQGPHQETSEDEMSHRGASFGPKVPKVPKVAGAEDNFPMDRVVWRDL